MQDIGETATYMDGHSFVNPTSSHALRDTELSTRQESRRSDTRNHEECSRYLDLYVIQD